MDESTNVALPSMVLIWVAPSLAKLILASSSKYFRKNSSTFAKLPFADNADQCGIKIVHLPTGALTGEVMYQASVDEIYEVAVLPNTIRPNILNTINPIHKYSLAIPGKTYWANPTDPVFNK